MEPLNPTEQDQPVIVGLVGPMGVGKSTLLGDLEARGFHTVELSGVVRTLLARAGIVTPTRDQYRERARSLRQHSHPAILAELALKETPPASLGVSGIRHPAEIDYLRGLGGRRVVVVGLVATFHERLQRILGRSRGSDPVTESEIIAKLLADWRGDTDIPGAEELLRACDVVVSTSQPLESVRDQFAALVDAVVQSGSPDMAAPNDHQIERFQEIEKRAVLTEAQRDALVRRLDEAGAEVLHESRVVDHYLCSRHVRDFAEIEMDRVGSYSFRVRRQTEGGQEKATVNAKVITTQGDHSAWDEHEITVDSFENTQALLAGIGYKTYFTLDKRRWEYRLGDVGVFLEKIADFGWAVELEILAPASLAAEMKKKLEVLLTEFGVQPDQVSTKSITNQLMRQRARFDE